MKLKHLIAVVDDDGREERVRISLGNVAGELTYFQAGAPVEVLGYTLPIAESVLNLAQEGELETT